MEVDGYEIDRQDLENRDAIDQAIEVLNRVHAADPTVLPALISHWVPCNLAVADDPTVQVGRIEGTEDEWEVGLLGIVNGLYGVQGPKAVGFIAANYDDDHNLTGFSYNELSAEARPTRSQAGLGEQTTVTERADP